MRVSKDFVARVFAMAGEKLAVGGFQKRKPGVFTLGLNTEIIGWVGLNTAHYQDGIAINPVVGVRHQKLEALIAQLLDTTPSQCIPASLSYLMPQHKYIEWSFKAGHECEPLVGEMVTAIEKFGWPFMKQNLTLESLYNALLNSKRGISPDQLDYRIAAAADLLGKHTEAETFIDAKLREIGNRNDEAAKWFRKFATKLGER